MGSVSSREADEDKDVIVQGVEHILMPSGEKALEWCVWEGKAERANCGSDKSLLASPFTKR